MKKTKNDNGQNDKELLKSAAEAAVDKIIKLAENEDTETKIKLDAYKWLCEMYFGKPQSSQRSDPDADKTLHLSFEGDLDKWSN